MGVDLPNIISRLERDFGIEISWKDLLGLISEPTRPDILVGDLFDFVRNKARRTSALVLDDEMDTASLWPMFQFDVSDVLGCDPAEVTKDKWLRHDLGAE